MELTLLTISLFDGKNMIISIVIVLLLLIFVVSLRKKIFLSSEKKELQHLAREKKLEEEKLASEYKDFEKGLPKY